MPAIVYTPPMIAQIYIKNSTKFLEFYDTLSVIGENSKLKINILLPFVFPTS
jgi:hypothetical protein